MVPIQPTGPLMVATPVPAMAQAIGRADPASEYAATHREVSAADGQRIPTLDAVLDIAKTAKKPFKLFVELKTSFAERERSADPVALAEATVRG